LFPTIFANESVLVEIKALCFNSLSSSPTKIFFISVNFIFELEINTNQRPRIQKLGGDLTGGLAGDGGAFINATFLVPQGLAFDETRNLLFIADTGII
jgi:hypothetical protein